MPILCSAVRSFNPSSCAHRVARMVMLACLSWALGGCGALYLRSESAKDATAKAQAELDQVDLAPLFDNEAKYLDELEKREYAAVAKSLSAQRDSDLLFALQGLPEGKDANGEPTEAQDGRAFMAERIDGYLQAMAGSADGGGPTRYWSVIAQVRRAASHEVLAGTLAAALKRERFVPPDRSIPSMILSGMTLDEAIGAARNAAEGLKRNEESAVEELKKLKTLLTEAEKQLTGPEPSQTKFEDKLADVMAYLEDAKQKANPFLMLSAAQTLQEFLDDSISVTDPKGSDKAQGAKARTAIGFVKALFGVGDAFGNPPRVPHPNALAAVQASLRYAANRAAAQVMEDRAIERINRAQLEAVMEQVYYLSRAGEALDDTGSTVLRKDAGLAQLQNDQKAAVRRAAGEALYYYAAAWSKGFIPAKQLDQVAMSLAERRTKLAHSRLSSEAWLGALEPAVATLAAYGEGGIDPKIIAEFLKLLGIGAIAEGVN